MISEQAPGIALELMAGAIEATGDLYYVYGRKFQEYAGVWYVLSAEDKVNAGWIRRLAGDAVKGSLRIEKGRFNGEAIENSGKYVRYELDKAENEALTPVYALSVALNIEQALIEAKHFGVHENDPAELKHLLHTLDSATRRNIRRVNELWDARRQ